MRDYQVLNLEKWRIAKIDQSEKKRLKKLVRKMEKKRVSPNEERKERERKKLHKKDLTLPNDFYPQLLSSLNLYFGIGVEEGKEEALKCFSRLSEEGCFLADAINRFFGGEEEEASQMFQIFLEAKLGEDETIFQIRSFVFFLDGFFHQEKSVVKSQKRAMELFEEAAGRGNSCAMCKLAEIYEAGIFCCRDVGRSFQLYKSSAEKGHVGGMVSLAGMYFSGIGVEMDYVRAAEWYMKAASLGNAFSHTALAGMHLSGSGVEESLELAAQFYQIASDKGCEKGLCSSAVANNQFLFSKFLILKECMNWE